MHVTCAGEPFTSAAAGLSKGTMNSVISCKKYLKYRSSTNARNNANYAITLLAPYDELRKAIRAI